MATPILAHYNAQVALDYTTSAILKGSSVTVRLPGTTTAATIYSSRAGGAKANPFTTSSTTGNFDFWAPPGDYDLLINGVTTRVTVFADPIGHAVPSAVGVESAASIGGSIYDAGPTLNAEYQALDAAGGGTLLLPPGYLRLASDWTWDSSRVHVMGPGAASCEIRTVGPAGIRQRVPDVEFTTEHGPIYQGFTVRGDPSNPGAAIGVKCTNMVNTRWVGVAIRGFAGGSGASSSVGINLDNDGLLTERNYLGLTLDQNKVDLDISVSGDPTWLSFEYNTFDLLGNTWSGQTLIRSRDNAYIRGGKLNVPAFNDVDDGTFLRAEDESIWDIDANVWGELTLLAGHPNTGFVGVNRATNARVYLSGRFELRGATYVNPPNPVGVPDPMMILGGSFTQDTNDRLASILQMLYIPHPAPPIVGMLGEGGTSPPAAVVAAGSNTTRGHIDVGTGTAPAGNGQLAIVTFAIPLTLRPYVTLTPTTYAAANIRPYAFNQVPAGFWIGCGVSPAAGQPVSVYGFDYHCIA